MVQAFIDTNVFLYAAGSEHPLKEPCGRVLRAIAAGTLEANTSTEVVQEILYVVGRRGDRARAVQLSQSVMGLFPELLPVTPTDMRLACDIFAADARVSTRDAVHAATMLNNGIMSVVSADKHFDLLEQVRRIPPESL